MPRLPISVVTAVIPLVALALVGPPSIRVTHEGVRGDTVAFVTGQHHSDDSETVVQARLETMASGQRVSYPLTLDKVAGKGRYAVRRRWDPARPVVLVMTVAQDEHDDHGVAEAVVKIARGGRVVAVDYPKGEGDPGARWPRRATAAEVDAALAQVLAANE